MLCLSRLSHKDLKDLTQGSILSSSASGLITSVWNVPVWNCNTLDHDTFTLISNVVLESFASARRDLVEIGPSSWIILQRRLLFLNLDLTFNLDFWSQHHATGHRVQNPNSRVLGTSDWHTTCAHPATHWLQRAAPQLWCPFLTLFFVSPRSPVTVLYFGEVFPSLSQDVYELTLGSGLFISNMSLISDWWFS